jgi:hypothetical protein
MAFEYIRFADTKAAIILALSTALLGGMITAKVHHYCGPSRIDSSDPHFGATFQGLGALLTFAFLLVSFTAAILALAPRLSVGRTHRNPPAIRVPQLAAGCLLIPF